MSAKSSPISPKTSSLPQLSPKPTSGIKSSSGTTPVSIWFSAFNPEAPSVPSSSMDSDSDSASSSRSDSSSDSEPVLDSPARTITGFKLREDAPTKKYNETAQQLANERRIPEGKPIKNLFPR